MAFGISTGRKVVTTAATREALASSSLKVQWIVIQAETDNTGIITVGGAGVVGALSTRQGLPLVVGDKTPPLFDVDLAEVYLDTTVNGDGVTYMFLS